MKSDSLEQQVHVVGEGRVLLFCLQEKESMGGSLHQSRGTSRMLAIVTT